jgi:hypothetical protein
MPWIDDPIEPQPILPTGTTAPNPISPSGLDVVAAAFRQENPMVSVARRLWDGFYEPEPGHNPLNHIAGTMFEERFSDRFVGSQSGAETFAIMQRIQEEERDRETLDAGGFGGTVAQIGAGILDPTLALPGGVLVRGARGSYSLVKSAASVSAAAALSTSVSETALQLTHETRTLGESMAAISSAAVLGGIIGAGAAGLLSRVEREILEAGLDRERVAIDEHVRQDAHLFNIDAFHGTTAEFQTFDPLKLGSSTGAPSAREAFFFSKNAKTAEAYTLTEPLERQLSAESQARLADLRAQLAKEKSGTSTMSAIRALEDQIQDVFRSAPLVPMEGANIRPSRLRLENPMVHDFGGAEQREISFKKLIDQAKAAGHDGVIFKNVRDGGPVDDIYAVFSPEQIRARYSDAPVSGGTSLPASAGAAASDARALELESSGLGFSSPISTTRRVLSSDSTEARRAMADLAESPYRFKENEEGIATTQGPALDRITRTQINATRVEVSDGLDRLFSEYRFGDPETSVPRLKARFEDMTGRAPDRLSFDDFKKEVSKALQEADTHTIPQVQAAAQLIRARVFEPWKERAIAAGLLPEGVDVKTAASYFQRVYNKERIRAERPFFVNKVQDWLKSDQITKAAAKERLTALNDELQGIEARLAKASEDEAVTLAARHTELRTRIEEEIAAWEGKSASEAKAAMKAREQYDAARQAKAADEGAEAPTNRLSAADSAIDRAVKRIIESDRDLSDAELRARGHEITERILGSPDGRLPYDIPMGGPEIGWRGPGGEPARGPLAARQFNIPDAVIRDFLEDDVETVVAMHLRTIVPDVLLTERFGDVRMTEAFKKIEEDYARLTDAATSAKERNRLGKEREAVIRDLAAVRDRVRGVYGWSPELRNMARIAAGAKAVNNLTSMGVAAVSSLSDFAGAILRFGLTNTLRDGWAPFFSNMVGGHEGWQQFKSQIRAVGIGIDVATNARQNALDDVTDVYRPGSRFERGLQAVNDKFFIANLLSPLTDMQKTIAAHVAVSEILRAAKAAAEGKATKKQIGNLAESGIDQQMAGRIWAQFQTGGEVVDGVHLPNTKDWSDHAAADALNGAMSREVDIAVVTPGQEKPLWMSHPVLSLLGQFKSFTAAATERILVANLMRRDAHALTGVMASVALGMLSYKLNSFLGGQETSKRPQDWVKEGISRGGLLGWFEEGNAMASKMTRGGADIYRMIGADKPLSRFASRSTLDMLLGPTASKIEGLAKVTGAAAARDWSAADTTAMRRLMAFQNLIWIRGAINQAEGGFNGMLGVPPRAEPEQRR